MSSWFGDEDAERCRENGAGHRSRSLKNYSRPDGQSLLTCHVLHFDGLRINVMSPAKQNSVLAP
ncbi:hypothetical protein ACFP76_16415 [Paracoccus aerius]|uniref:hypothetical protein n=1 Tax=Paracoccus aerius TaxID=1915382 RepID=UPI0017486774